MPTHRRDTSRCDRQACLPSQLCVLMGQPALVARGQVAEAPLGLPPELVETVTAVITCRSPSHVSDCHLLTSPITCPRPRPVPRANSNRQTPRSLSISLARTHARTHAHTHTHTHTLTSLPGGFAGQKLSTVPIVGLSFDRRLGDTPLLLPGAQAPSIEQHLHHLVVGAGLAHGPEVDGRIDLPHAHARARRQAGRQACVGYSFDWGTASHRCLSAHGACRHASHRHRWRARLRQASCSRTAPVG
jgi:hypothetical protein